MSSSPAVHLKLSCVDEMTQCPICLRDLDNPRSLPCLHTFCLRCLQTQWHDRSPGDRMPCPVCRAALRIPSDGLTTLPHNFFLQQLIDAKHAAVAEAASATSSVAAQVQPQCDVCCATVDGPVGQVAAASVYCVDCRQKLCERCGQRHVGTGTDTEVREGPAARPPQRHHRLRLVKLSTTNPHDATGRQPATSANAACYCDKHADRPLELYCFECKTNVCLMCFVVEHKHHECQDIKQVGEKPFYELRRPLRRSRIAAT
jgi:tripartite motif-containing protein 56